MEKAFQRIYWENKPSTETPIDANNLNRIEAGVDTIDDRVVTLDSQTSGLTTRVTTAESNITSLQNGKVDKVSGKGLSTNDYTTTEKNKLAGISTQANRTTVTQVQESGDTSKEIAQIGLDGETTSIYADDAKKVIESCYEEKTVTGNPLTIKTISGSNAKALTVSMNPIQDLHGYSNPWAGGAGKNKLPFDIDDIKADNTNGTWSGNTYNYRGVTYTLSNDGKINVTGTVTAENASALLLANNIVLPSGTYLLSGIFNGSSGTYRLRYSVNSGSYYNIYDGDSPEITLNGTDTLRVQIYMASNFVCPTGGITFEPMIRLSTVTDATFEPYSNICPISGRTEASVTRTGKNQCDTSAFDGVSHYIVNTDGSITVNSSDTRSWSSVTEIPLKAGTYTVSKSGTTGTSDIRLSTEEFNTGHIFTTSFTFTLETDGSVKTKLAYGGVTYPQTYTLQIESDSTATAYEPYQAETHTKEFGQTVYSGSLNLNSGMLTIDRVLGVLNGTETGYSSVGGSYPQAYRLDNSIFSNGFASNTWTDWAKNSTNKYPAWNTAAGATDYGIRFQNGNANTLFIYDARFQNDLNGFLADLQSNPLQFCYMLATPIELQLSPEVVTLLKGLNVISTDGDNIKLTASQLASITDVINDNVISEGSTFSSSKIDSFTEEKTLDVLDSLTQEITKSGNPIALTTNYGNVLKSCELSMSPIQDLHGYDSPWAGGAGKNKLPFDLATIKANNTEGTWNGNVYTIDGVTWTVNEDGSVIANGTPTVGSSASLLKYLGDGTASFSYELPSADYKITTGFTSAGSTIRFEIGYRATSGTIRHIYNNNGYELDSANVNLIQLVIREGYTANNLEFEPMIVATSVSDYTFAPYSNICPISGRTETSVTRPGKNLFDKSSIIRNYAYKNDTGHEYVSVQGISTYFIDIVAGMTLTISGMKNWGTGYINCFVNSNKEYIQTVGTRTSSGGVGNPVTVTAPNGARYLAMACYTGTSDYNLYQDKDTIQVEVGSTATDYEPYQGETVTVQLGQTVYGGTLDVTNGKLLVDKVLLTFNGNEDWSYTQGAFLLANAFNEPNNTFNLFAQNPKSNKYVAVTRISNVIEIAGIANNSMFNQTGTNYKRLWVKDNSCSTAEAFKTSLATTPLQICYTPLNTTEITLTAEQISLLNGNNVLSTNADDMELSYQELPDITSLAQYVQTLEARIKALEEG